jgi:hypothetical protein
LLKKVDRAIDCEEKLSQEYPKHHVTKW